MIMMPAQNELAWLDFWIHDYLISIINRRQISKLYLNKYDSLPGPFWANLTTLIHAEELVFEKSDPLPAYKNLFQITPNHSDFKSTIQIMNCKQ